MRREVDSEDSSHSVPKNYSHSVPKNYLVGFHLFHFSELLNEQQNSVH